MPVASPGVGGDDKVLSFVSLTTLSTALVMYGEFALAQGTGRDEKDEKGMAKEAGGREYKRRLGGEEPFTPHYVHQWLDVCDANEEW